MRAALLCLALTACGIQPCFARPGPLQPAVSMTELRSVWAVRFGRLPACEDPYWDVRDCGPGVAGCTFHQSGCPIIWIDPGLEHDRGLAAHEFAHFAAACQTGDSDPNHTRADVWGPGGFVQGYR